MEIDRSVCLERDGEEHAFDVREPLRLILGIAADKGPPAAADRPFIFGIDVEGHLRGERERRADRRAEGRVGARQAGVRIADAGADAEAVDRPRGDFQLEAFAFRVAGIAERAERSEEHTSELQSLMRISYAVFRLKKKTQHRSLTLLIY